MLANIRFEISISSVLQKSQLFCVYHERKQSGDTSGARLKMESEAMGAWSPRPLRVILTPEVSAVRVENDLGKKNDRFGDGLAVKGLCTAVWDRDEVYPLSQ